MPAPSPEPGPPRASAWRGLLFLVPIALWTLGGAALVALIAVLVPAVRRGGFVPLVRLWGRVPLRLCGVALEVHGREHVATPAPRLILFNHVSLLDLYVLAALAPPRPLVLYKKEFSRIPGLGLALRTLRMIPVDRGNHEAAVRSVAEAGQRLVDEGASCLMAPEGTRSRRGGLQDFKLGAFHLAATRGIPIVPMVMQGIERVLPMGSYLIRSGTVRVDYLAPIDTTGWRADEARSHAREVRARFLELAPPAPGSEGGPPLSGSA
jgi:putative phosphoserine phosphatase/1-acylglycerol-3-phosphate O-acyltransferase